MNKIAYSTLLAAYLLFSTESSQCEWTAVSRPGGDIRSLAFYGDTLYGVGSKARMFSTTNSGETWAKERVEEYSSDFTTFYTLSVFQEVSLLGVSSGGICLAQSSGRLAWRRCPNTGTDDILAFADSRGKAAVTFLAGGFGGGVRVSLDSGKTWSPSNNGLTNTNITSLASGESLPDSSGQVLIAGTYGEGVFASTDNGQSWSQRGVGLSTFLVNAMEIAGDRIYVAGNSGRVCVSSDWGNSWQEMGAGLPCTELLSIASVKDATNEWIYCGTIDAGVWRCPAEGGIWISMNTGLGNLRINSIITKAGALFVGTHDGISRSWDGGATWTRVTDAGSPPLNALHAVPPSAPDGEDLLVAGTQAVYWAGDAYSSVFSSDNNGLNWRATGPIFDGAVLSISDHDGTLFLLSRGRPGEVHYGSGLNVSTDMGATWEWRSRWSTEDFSCMEIVPTADRSRLDCFIAAVTGHNVGVAFSSDTGHSWRQISDKRAFAMGSADPFLVVRDSKGVYRTSDYGMSWQTITSHLAGNEVISFARDRDRLLACISYDLANSRPGGVLMTTDAGDSWLSAGLVGRTVTSLVPIGDYLLAAADGKVYAATRQQFDWVDVTGNILNIPVRNVTATTRTCYVLGSDGKSIWQRPMAEIIQILSSVPAPPELRFPPNGIEGCPPSAIMRWTKPAMATKFWLQLTSDSTFGGAFAVNNSSVIDTFIQVAGLEYGRKYFWRVAAGNESGFSRFCAPWSYGVAMIPTLPAITNLVYPPDSLTLFMNGVRLVWHTARPEVTRYWLEVATDPAYQHLTVDSVLVDTTRIWICTEPYGGRFWWHVRAYNSAGWGPFSETRMFTLSPCGVDKDREIPATFLLDQNFPNPFNPSTTIRFGLPISSAVTLVVYNTLGQEVRTLVDGNIDAGFHAVTFDAAELPSGLYFYRMRAGDFVETRKLLLVR
jgi:photosystem II stability/assembly factor-like uncharacterized protein